jgi:sulfite reductase alpha subunit-like flavoprotein
MITLKIEDDEFILGSQELPEVISSLDDESTNTAFFEKLSHHPSFWVRAAVAQKREIDFVTILRLSEDKDLNVLQNLAKNRTFRSVAKFNDLKRLSAIGDSQLSINLAHQIDDYQSCDSGQIIEIFMRNTDPHVREALATNWCLSKKILKRLQKDKDPMVREAASYSLKSKDRWQ